MGKIMIFAGTTEGRRLSEILCQNGRKHIVSVATAYGEQVLTAHPCAEIHQGRMDADAMKEYFLNRQIEVVIDATHPYAQEVTNNIRQAAEAAGVKYMRLIREMEKSESGQSQTENPHVIYFPDHESCEQALLKTRGNIFLTTGSKDLEKYCIHEEVKQRLIVRVLPGKESIALCEDRKLLGRQIIAMQGPFSEEMNAAVIHQYDIQCMVTKQSGKNGGFEEKLLAAKKAGIPLYVIGCKAKEEGSSFCEICQQLGISLPPEPSIMKIYLIGCGMGTASTLTEEAKDKIEQADILLGAARLIKPYSPKIEKHPYYLAEDIIPYLMECQKRHRQPLSVVILFSGDTGFYSGCKKLWDALAQSVEKRELHARVETLSGISSIVYLSAKLHESWEDAAIISLHGKGKAGVWSMELKEAVCYHRKTFLLVSGAAQLTEVGILLQKWGLETCRLVAGYNLSYEDESIQTLTPKECGQLKDGLYTCLIRNLEAQDKPCSYFIPDADFLCGQVPMTKEEIRQLSIAKLRLCKQSVVYDIGSGTGSIAVEIAGMSEQIQVYAIERRKDAIALIRENREKFGRDNIHIVEAQAPEGLNGLPVPTHAFIGGSGGHLTEILHMLHQKNPSLRVVLNAVSMETMQECFQIQQCFPVEDYSMVQVAVTRTRKMGNYHMMQGENPVWICSFRFREG